MKYVYLAFIRGEMVDLAFTNRWDAVAWVEWDPFVRSYKAVPVYDPSDPVPDLG